VTPEQERKHAKYEEKFFKSHRELPTGRDFRWNMQIDPKADDVYRKNFDSIFPSAPGAGL